MVNVYVMLVLNLCNGIIYRINFTQINFFNRMKTSYEFIFFDQISITALQNFLEQMESGYSKYRNPYHNLIHAADVLQTTYQIIYNSGLMVEVNGVSLFNQLCSFCIEKKNTLLVHLCFCLACSKIRCFVIYLNLGLICFFCFYQNWLTDHELFAMFIAAIVHDFEHTGTSNNFHIQSR